MRQIGSIPVESQARIFRAYLLSLGLHSDIEQNRDRSWAVWVHEETRLDEAREHLAQFLADPRDPRYIAAADIGEKRERAEKKEQQQYRERYVDMRTHWHLSQMTGGPLTMILIVISVVVTLMQNLPGVSNVVIRWLSIASYWRQDGFLVSSAIPLNDIRHGQIWRLITPIFLHFGIMHILFNMLWLKMLGAAVEGVEGTWRLSAQVLVYAIAGNVLQFYMTGPTFGGMSGVNYGLFAYVWLMGREGVDRRYYIDPVNIGLMLVWFFLCLFGIIPHVANGAHAAGLVLGVLWAVVRLRRVPFTPIRF